MRGRRRRRSATVAGLPVRGPGPRARCIALRGMDSDGAPGGASRASRPPAKRGSSLRGPDKLRGAKTSIPLESCIVFDMQQQKQQPTTTAELQFIAEIGSSSSLRPAPDILPLHHTHHGQRPANQIANSSPASPCVSHTHTRTRHASRRGKHREAHGAPRAPLKTPGVRTRRRAP